MMRAGDRVISVFGRFTLVIWVAAFVIGATPLLTDLRNLKGINISATELIGRDFVNIWHGGEMAGSGKSDTVYDRDAYRTALKEKVGIEAMHAYSYPPHMLAASIPFGWLPYVAALGVWLLGTLALFWYAARPWLAQAGLPSWIILLLPATYINIFAGHFGFLIGALVLIGFWHARDRPLVSGTAFAMMTVKPHLGVLVPIMLAASRSWRAIAWASAGTLLFVAASAWLFGADIWATYIKSTLPFQASLISIYDPDLTFIYMIPSVDRMASQYGFGSTATLFAQIGFSSMAFVLMFQGWRRGIEAGDLGLLSIVATFILLPYVFIYDMVAFNIAILVLASRTRHLLSEGEKIILGLTFLLPATHAHMAKMGVPLSPLLIMATLWILVRALSPKTASIK